MELKKVKKQPKAKSMKIKSKKEKNKKIPSKKTTAKKSVTQKRTQTKKASKKKLIPKKRSSLNKSQNIGYQGDEAFLASIEPYKLNKKEKYMSARQKKHFKKILERWRQMLHLSRIEL